MQITYSSTGTHEHKGQLKCRLDLYPESRERSYAQNYVYVPVFPKGWVFEDDSPQYQAKVKSLSHIWQLNPCLSVFIGIDENITAKLFDEYVKDVYTSDVLATIDNIMATPLTDNPHLHAHLISPFSRGKTTLSSRKTNAFDEQTKGYINQRLGAVSLLLPANGKANLVTPESIDIGAGATNRGTSWGVGNYTLVDRTNTANASGTLDTWELWMFSNSTGVQVATFFIVSGANLSTRDSETIGDVASGSKQTFAGLSTDVATNDLAGIYYATGDVELDNGASGCFSKLGDNIPTTDTTFASTNFIVSLYATGTEPPPDAPTVTTQAATDAATTSCTGNGNITATGGVNPTRRGFCYKEGTSGDPTTADSVVYDDGDFGTGAFDKAIAGLSPETGYRVRAYAVNTGGTGYGDTVQITTLAESNYALAFLGDSGYLSFVFYQAGIAKHITLSSLITGTTIHIAGTYDGEYQRLYKDGVSVVTPIARTGAIDNNDVSFTLGARDGLTNDYAGLMDEIRVSNVARSAEWLAATYAACWDTLGYWEVEGPTPKVSIAFASDPLDAPLDYTMLSCSVQEIHTRRGRRQEQDRMEAGTLSVLVDNSPLRENNALYFDGTANSNVDCGAINNAATKLWAGLWFRLPVSFSSASATDLVLLEKYVDVDNYLKLYLACADGKLHLVNRTGGTTHLDISSSATSWSADTWYHALVSISSVNGARLRVDNGTAVTNADTTAIVNGGNLVIGSSSVGGTDGIVGYIQEAQIGTDDLTTNEETDIFNGRAMTDATDYWPLVEGTGSTATSYGSAGNDGTIDSACVWDELTSTDGTDDAHPVPRGPLFPDIQSSIFYPNVDAMKAIKVECIYNTELYPVVECYIDEPELSWVGSGGAASKVLIRATGLLKILALNTLSSSGESSLLTANANAAQKDVTVADGTKFKAGQCVTLYDSTPDREACLIASISGNTLTMRDNLTNNYTTAASATCYGYLLAAATGTRAQDCLNIAGVPTAKQQLDAGTETIGASGALDNANMLSHLQTTTLDTELGVLYETREGYAAFEDRSHRVGSPHDTSQATFGDGEGALRIVGLAFSKSDTLLYNLARITRDGGVEQIVQNTTSQTQYGTRAIVKSGLPLSSDSRAYQLACYYIARFAGLASRVKKIVVDPEVNGGAQAATLWPIVLGYDLGTRITINLIKAGYYKDSFIESVAHDWTASPLVFMTTWELSDATQYFYSPSAITFYMRPNAAGSLTQLSPSEGSNYQCVDESIANDDTDYVYNSHDGSPGGGALTDLYALPDQTFTGDISSVIIRCRGRQVPASSSYNALMEMVVKTNEVTYYPESYRWPASTSEWQNLAHTYITNPQTGNAWTWAEINALQVGTRLTEPMKSGFYNGATRMTWIEVEVTFTPSWS